MIHVSKAFFKKSLRFPVLHPRSNRLVSYFHEEVPVIKEHHCPSFHFHQLKYLQLFSWQNISPRLIAILGKNFSAVASNKESRGTSLWSEKLSVDINKAVLLYVNDACSAIQNGKKVGFFSVILKIQSTFPSANLMRIPSVRQNPNST